MISFLHADFSCKAVQREYSHSSLNLLLTFFRFSIATTCEAQSVGLVRYPATLAPAVVTTQCADNATPTTSLSVTCRSDGRWTGSPQCQCNAGYQAANVVGIQVCQG